MSRAFLLTVLATLTFSLGQTIAKTPKPSADMILILIHHKSGPNDLDARKLPLDQTMDFSSKKELPEYEVYLVPYPADVADYFYYRVYLHTQSGRY